MAIFFRAARNGIDLFVRLTPRSSGDEIGEVETSADGRARLAVRVRAVPDKGKANAALEKLVAGWLGVPRTTVTVSAGQTQRLKTLRIEGDSEELAAQIRARTQRAGELDRP
jgi:uncharacterized protein YggU (UPF0235/DUF167 family)